MARSVCGSRACQIYQLRAAFVPVPWLLPPNNRLWMFATVN
jgi:hypothetical protein